ncbi:MAG: hypothetical protein ACHQRJ_14180 [Alphaproteobacteria bacterium]
MASLYLQPADYAGFGIAAATADQVQQASMLINGHLKRPEGLIWGADANGAPAYMAGLNAALALSAAAAFAPGSNVQVSLSGPSLGRDAVGEVVTVDRANAGACETCVIASVAPGGLTLQGVSFAHASGATLELGMAILEERAMPKDRSVTRLARWPVVRLLSGLGRYGYGRRDAQTAGELAEYNLLAVVSSFGGPPLWIPFDVSQADVSVATSEVWVPAGALLAYFSEVRLRYLAGWSAAQLPQDIKQACANIVRAILDQGMAANIESYSAGDTRVKLFSDTLLDADTKAMLAPYRARLFL